MGKSQLFLAATAAALAFGLSVPAAANPIPNSTAFDDSASFNPITIVSYDYTTYGTALKVTSPIFTGNVTIGPFIDTLDTGSGPFPYLVFCDDLGNDISPTGTPYSFWFSDPTIPDGATDYLSGLTAAQIDGIFGLVTEAFNNIGSYPTYGGAAFQLAIWNLEYGDSVTTDNSSVNTLAGTLESNALTFYANEFLGIYGPIQLESPCDTGLVGQISYTATPFPLDANKDNCQVQGQITVFQTGHTQNLPEPATMAILGSGLIGFGAFRRRRRKAA